jgi:hypothetical protein
MSADNELHSVSSQMTENKPFERTEEGGNVKQMEQILEDEELEEAADDAARALAGWVAARRVLDEPSDASLGKIWSTLPKRRGPCCAGWTSSSSRSSVSDCSCA